MTHIKVLFWVLIFANLSLANAQNNSVLITEIFADPTPTKGLPEREFIEIYNNTNSVISLFGYTLRYSSSNAAFPDVVLNPSEYAIVCRKGYESEFSSYGKVIPLSNFSLLNSGTLLVLEQADKTLSHFVNYDISWYSPGLDQGVSLEMKDLNQPCLEKSNWSSSVNPLGGTPGKVNSNQSVVIDLEGPILNSFSLQGKSLQLFFDEKLKLPIDNLSFVSSDSYYQVEDISFDKYEAKTLSLNLKNQIRLNDSFEVQISGIEDCVGNLAKDIKITLFNLVPADSGDVLLSEVLFNPFSGNHDFVEIYNVSGKKLNLKNWYFANKNNLGEISSTKTLSASDLYLNPKSYLAFTTNKNELLSTYSEIGKENIIEIASLPAYNLDAGSVILMNADKEIMDQLNYSESFHNIMIKNPKGVSLERASFFTPTDFPGIWLSSSAQFNFATPGFENSQKLDSVNIIKDSFVFEPQIFNPYNGNGNEVANLTYQLAEPGGQATVEIFDKNGVLVKSLAKSALLSTKGAFVWDGKNNAGQLLPVGYYLAKITKLTQNNSTTYFSKVVLGSF
jgi:hypothetical protein